MKRLRLALTAMLGLLIASSSLHSVGDSETCAPSNEVAAVVAQSDEPSDDPTTEPSDDPTTEPTPDPCEETVEPEPSTDPTVAPDANEESAEKSEDTDDADHGDIVSTVAHCAPRGHDPRFANLDVRSHGGFVKVAAHGGTLELNGESFDLSTLAGAKALCAALDAIEVPEGALKAKKHDKKEKHKEHKNSHDVSGDD